MVTKFPCPKMEQLRSAPVHGLMNALPFLLPARPVAVLRDGGPFYEAP
jgi:hypothetical protein